MDVVEMIEHASDDEFLLGVVRRGAKTTRLRAGRIRIIAYVVEAKPSPVPRRRGKRVPRTGLDPDCLV